jgi:hypothetical protein
MLKSILILASLTLAMSVVSIPACAQAKLNSAVPGSGDFASPTFLNATRTLAITQISAGHLTNSRSSSWFATFAPSRSMMLVFGACLLLFGAFLRRRPALRRPQSRPAPLREAQNESGMNLISETASMAEQNKTSSSLVTGPNAEKARQESITVVLAPQQLLVGQETIERPANCN